MSIELDNIASGYSTGKINLNFEKIEQYINDYLLHRDGLDAGESNQMELPLDMNGFPILNAKVDLSNPNSLITVGEADQRFVNVDGDSMSGRLYVMNPIYGSEPATKSLLDKEELERKTADINEATTRARADYIEANARASADANIQAQLTGEVPLEASAFSPISWHDQAVDNSVNIPPNKNAWSFGPIMTIASGQEVTVSEGSYWTIANGQSFNSDITNYDEGVL